MTLQKEWQWLCNSRPGERFQSRYRRTRRNGRNVEMTPRILRITLAMISLVIGICVIPLPVPELPFFLVAGALLATESLEVARGLDRFERGIHHRMQRLRRSCGLPDTADRTIGRAMFFTSLAATSCLCYYVL